MTTEIDHYPSILDRHSLDLGLNKIVEQGDAEFRGYIHYVSNVLYFTAFKTVGKTLYSRWNIICIYLNLMG